MRFSLAPRVVPQLSERASRMAGWSLEHHDDARNMVDLCIPGTLVPAKAKNKEANQWPTALAQQ